MTKPQVTIGIPFFNADRYLGLAIRSVFAQSFGNWRLLLVDDGSTDSSLQIARSVKDPRVEVISNGRNEGLPTRLNEITRRADTPLIARMDADDVMHPGRIEAQVRRFSQRRDVEVVGTATYTIDQDDRVNGIRGDGPVDCSIRGLLHNAPFVHPTVMMRREWAMRHPYELAFPRAEDLALWARTCGAMEADVLETPLMFYREPLPVNLRAYAVSSRSARRVIDAYGAPLAPVERFRMKTRRAASAYLYRIAKAMRRDGALVRARNRRVSVAEGERARAALAIVKRTIVPGLPAQSAGSNT